MGLRFSFERKLQPIIVIVIFFNKDLRALLPSRGEAISRLLLWSPRYQPLKSRKLTFPEIISRDTGIATQDLRVAMQNKNVWRAVVRGILAEAEG